MYVAVKKVKEQRENKRNQTAFPNEPEGFL